jgi:uncharacterized NAD-dependent epimerase/dehydratase family protein
MALMTNLTTIQLRTPYLILIGEEDDATYAKTGFGIVQWQPERVAGQMRFPGCRLDLGVPDMTIEEAAANGVGSLVVGVAPVGGVVPDSWWHAFEAGARAGLDIVCGLHEKLSNSSRLVQVARESGARLIDIRTPPGNLPVGSGARRSGKRLLTVGTDCAVGKKYTALSLHKAMRDAGIKSTFRASGQTGIMIAGEGIAIDCVVADFVAGAAELLSPENDEDHWDLIEGQGSLFHPGYSAVSMGLLHGSQPDAIVVCHDAGRTAVSGWDEYMLPSIAECMEENLAMGRRTNPDIRCVGISVNTSELSRNERIEYLGSVTAETGLPCVDPLIDGCSVIVDHMINCTNQD